MSGGVKGGCGGGEIRYSDCFHFDVFVQSTTVVVEQKEEENPRDEEVEVEENMLGSRRGWSYGGNKYELVELGAEVASREVSDRKSQPPTPFFLFFYAAP